jgi:hypothetical protein
MLLILFQKHNREISELPFVIVYLISLKFTSSKEKEKRHMNIKN